MAGHLVRTDAVLTVDDEPYGRQPLVEAKRRVLENSASLEREFGLRVLGVALPHARLFEVHDVVRTTLRARHLAIRPPQVDHESAAVVVVAEKADGLL